VVVKTTVTTVTTTGMEVRPAATPTVMMPGAAAIGTRPGVSSVLVTSGVIALVLLAQPTPKTWMHLLFFLLPRRFAPGGA
jgi:hypothetical protein